MITQTEVLPIRERVVRARQELSPAGRIGLVLAVVALAFGLYGGARADTDLVDGYGIIAALHPIYWVGVALGGVGSFLLLRAALNERTRYAAVVPMIWLGILHTGPALAHRHFRFPTVWTHLGFVRVIDETNSGDVLIDARFAWPGFFGATTPALANVNVETLEWIMRLWPTAILAATSVLVSALATRSYPTVPLIGPLSAVAYILLSWTGQDYYSPQSFGFTAYLCILVLLESGPLRTSAAWSASVPFLARFAAAGGERPAARSTPIFVSLIILSYGAIVSHPLAPFFICTGLVISGLYGRTVAWRLLVFIATSYVIWFFVTAEPWWSTQLPDMLDQIGGLFTNAESGTINRTEGSSPERVFVTRVRSVLGLATFVSVLAIGVAMATERFRHLRPAVPLAPLAGIPSIALALQSYGGEIIFRVVLFTLPMAAILFGRMLAAIRVRAIPLVIPVVILIMMPGLMLARFGNESFEMTTAVDREVMEAGYARARDDTMFVTDNGFVPFKDQTVDTNFFMESGAKIDEEWITELERIAAARGTPRIIILFTPSQRQWRIHGLSSEEDYLDTVAEWLIDRGATVLYAKDGGWALEL